MLTLSNKKYLLTLLALVTIVLQVVAISTEYWATYKSPGMVVTRVEEHWGLWKQCITVSGNEVCRHTPPSDDKKFKKNSLEATRAFAIMGPLFVSMSVLSMYMRPSAKKWHCALMLLGAVCSLVAMTIFAAELLKLDESKGTPGYSFYLNLAGGVMALVAVLVCWAA